MPKKKPTPEPKPDGDADIIKGALLAMIEAHGRGGKTWASKKVGMHLSAFLKRLKLPGAGLDEFTMKAITLVIMHKEDALGPEATRHGQFLATMQDGEPVWSPAPEQP